MVYWYQSTSRTLSSKEHSMKHQRSMAVAALGLAIGYCGVSARPAHAQSLLRPTFRAKVGLFLPSGSGEDFSGNNHLKGEAEVLLPKILSGVGTTNISIGYSQGSSDGRTLRIVPVTIGKIFSPPNPAKLLTGNVYGGVGVGPYFLRASGGGDSDNKTSIGGYAMVGYEFKNKFFLEAKYQVVSKIRGVSPSGLSLMVGRSF